MKQRTVRRYEPLSDFEIEAYLCGELNAADTSRVELAIGSDVELRAYIEQRQEARAVFAQKHPLRMPPRRLQLRWAFPLLGAAAAALVCVMVSRSSEQATHAAVDTVRVKGHVGLHAHLAVKRGEQVWAHRPELPLRAGDQLMLAADSDGPGFISLLGRDVQGHIAIYYDALRTPGGRFVAPGSLTLDAQAGDEQWLVVFSPQRVAAEVYAQKLAAAELADLDHSVFRIRKEAP